MPMLGVTILVYIVGFVLLAVILMAGLIWMFSLLLGRSKILDRTSSNKPQKVYSLGLLVSVAILALVVVWAAYRSSSPAAQGRATPGYAGYMDIGSPALRPFQAMYAVKRAKYGFTPLPTHTDTKIEKLTGVAARTAGYDVLLHIYPTDNDPFTIERTVSFKLVNNKYQWIGEQETWIGPGQYTLPDGSSTHEQISISYATQPGLGAGITNTLQIMYEGNDPRLSGKDNLTLKDIQPVLKSWGAL